MKNAYALVHPVVLACLSFLTLTAGAQTLNWATYHGGTANDFGEATAMDGDGNLYVAGSTVSTSGIASGGHQNTHGGSFDAFLAKYDADGALLWATYYGGPNDDFGYSCAVDANGNVYLAGQTFSSTAIASGGHQNTYGLAADAYLVKFNSTGVRQWATYYGSDDVDEGRSCAVDGDGNVYLSGHTESTTAIASGGHQNTLGGMSDAFLVKFNSTGVRQWGTYYGSTGEEEHGTCATTAGNFVYLSGNTTSASGMTSNGSQTTFGGGTDAFLVRFDATGVRQWATYYGGAGNEDAGAVCADATGFAYVLGATNSTTIAHLGHQMVLGGQTDAFLVRFNAGGSRSWCTYYGGPLSERAFGCTVDPNGNVFLVGEAASLDSISTPDAMQETNAGSTDAFVVKFDFFCTRLWGTYFGGTAFDSGHGCSFNAGSLYVGGHTTSSAGVALNGNQNTHGGNSDGWAWRFDALGVGMDEVAGPSTGNMQLWPNPVQDGTLWLSVDDPGTASAVVQLRDLSGRIVRTERVSMGHGTVRSMIAQDVTPGSYTVSITIGERRLTRSVVIEE